jgi:hypothetical protein
VNASRAFKKTLEPRKDSKNIYEENRKLGNPENSFLDFFLAGFLIEFPC